MRFLTFEDNGQPVPAIVRGDSAVDLRALDPDLPRDWATLLARDNLERLATLAEAAPDHALRPLAGLRYLPPIPAPPKTLCVGLNYRAHAAETGMDLPRYPIFFTRFPTSFVGHQRAMVCPSVSEKYDYEGELVAVIGRGGRSIPRERALDHVVGYSIFNDGSVRDFQKRAKQWTLGKNFDASGAFGPHVVTADELPEGASGLGVETRLNGEVMQSGRTDDLIFTVADLVAAAGEAMTLEPGSILVTGTPPGVGMARDPYVWMKAGDTVSITIEGIGTLTNPVVAEG
ncbi:2-keto-4-pentenoate hydratase/2-oxohepta-3-ene-1,7-dioic acid hydratase (catechol pathway) [Limimonas halophila]|uniref:2-keto-4-pentenoate hydratase/2-oxohepta-3-ene-1,7-dioic acid hydratase (Catechol pathway) n=1 Tax=Limimonas halophila TaxID=1082479 RepID=A0A1G7UBZ9_9PROT|nr:fumarylacetoacetate hydrolase family protein [Limimonas halophila]SDG44987.1 2-keto-4-pentenoate hydratase/2-oxohepta-3-ene-1,7-dioic acid hydratase (catechol pathway) [Limimonas halophila]